jgi:hypothetical protein
VAEFDPERGVQMAPLNEDALRLLRQKDAPDPAKLADFERRRQEMVARSKALSATEPPETLKTGKASSRRSQNGSDRCKGVQPTPEAS